MKKIINRKVYNTETAELIGEYWNGCSIDDYNYKLERLYVTKKGNMFLFRTTGTWLIKDIIPLEPEEAYEWLEENDCNEAIEKYFADKIEEA